MNKRRVALDLVPIRPGQGGTGSGIWTYARELVKELDSADWGSDLQGVVLLTREQLALMPPLRQLRAVVMPAWGRRAVTRLLWVHLLLPGWLLLRRVSLLHKLATEIPVWSPCRCVTTIHDLFADFVAREQPTKRDRRYRYFSWMSRYALRHSAAVITDAAAIRDELQQRYGKQPAALHVVPIGVRPPSPDKTTTTPPAGRVLYLAKLMPYKGQRQAIEAWRVLQEQYPQESVGLTLTLQGYANDDAFMAELTAAIQRLPNPDAVKIRPYIKDVSLAELYADADLLMFLSAYEGFGLPVIEAQAHGVPVVASDLPVLREVGGEAAVYVDRNQPEAIAAAVLRTLQDTDMRNRLIEQGRAHAEHFAWSATATQTLRVYRSALTNAANDAT
jgi:glycosyltransferase involved in cell wall biosynthesis